MSETPKVCIGVNRTEQKVYIHTENTYSWVHLEAFARAHHVHIAHHNGNKCLVFRAPDDMLLLHHFLMETSGDDRRARRVFANINQRLYGEEHGRRVHGFSKDN